MDTSHLKKEYGEEQTRLNSLCDKWQTILDDKRQKIYSEDIRGAILSVLGQTRLLLNKKLKQFEQLLSDGEQQFLGMTGEGGPGDAPLIKLRDLEGYWEVVMLQVFEWFKRFKDGHKDMNNDKQTGRPSSAKIDDSIENIRIEENNI